MSLNQIKDAVADLPEKARGSLAAWLLDSLPPHAVEDGSDAGIEEAARRRDELDAGKIQLVSADEFWTDVNGTHVVEVKYHPLVKRDIAEALRYYDKIAARLADEFEEEVKVVVEKAAENPLRHHSAGRDFRRPNLPRFSYHVLYEIHTESLRVMHIRHNKRHPDYGMERE